MHPSHYGHEETEAHAPFDPKRDGVTLPLIRAAVAAGAPVLGICRGFQELAVAFGATLHPEIRDLPGRMNHRMPPDGTVEEKFALRHAVTFAEGGTFHRLLGATEVMTNTLHGQGIIDPGPRVVIEGHAPDGTPEAIVIRYQGALKDVSIWRLRHKAERRAKIIGHPAPRGKPWQLVVARKLHDIIRNDATPNPPAPEVQDTEQ